MTQTSAKSPVWAVQNSGAGKALAIQVDMTSSTQGNMHVLCDFIKGVVQFWESP